MKIIGFQFAPNFGPTGQVFLLLVSITHKRALPRLSIVSFLILWLYPNPVELILLARTMKAFLLPILGFGAIYFRYNHYTTTLKPTRAWDTCLWISP
ncbi:MAG: hypothetical protein CMI18_12645 [Opitutaceae bacterium]|nr:hypothetical protein [Opitutaceae bacterium]